MLALMQEIKPDAALLRLIRRPLALTWAGLWVERGAQAFWPLISLLALSYALWAFGLSWAVILPALGLGGVGAWVYAWRGFARPRQRDALARLDQSLPQQPIRALADHMALGAQDRGAVVLWQAHQARMAARLADLRAVAPVLDLNRRDPFALRLMAATALVMAVIFAPDGQARLEGASGGAQAADAGPAWEGWVEPPRHTGLPTLYLPDLTAPEIEIAQGARITIRLYGDAPARALRQTLSDQVEARADGAVFTAERAGEIAIDLPQGRQWRVRLRADTSPEVTLEAPARLQGQSETALPFAARDDYGVVSGEVEITVDFAALDRRYGLAAQPDPRAPLILDLPMPFTGDRRDFSEVLIEDLSQDVLANLPVILRVSVRDGAGQVGMVEQTLARLPARRFFDPLAAALVEQRRDLLWAKANAPRVATVLRALTHLPEGFITDQSVFLALRGVIRRLDAAGANLTPETRDEIAQILWEAALSLEETDLDDALAALRQAQDRLSEAIRRGASPEEMAQLMDELQRAMDEYIRELAQSAEPSPTDEPDGGEGGQELAMNDLAEMMRRIEELMEQGRIAEAQALLDALGQMLENLQVTQGQGGENGPVGRAIEGLSETLRDQQDLADDAFGQAQGRPPAQGEAGEGETGESETGEGGASLAERQEALRRALEGQAENLPGQGRSEGQEARDNLDAAGRAMDEAATALEQGDFRSALDAQARAMENMREGIDALGRAFAQDQGEGQDGTESGTSPNGRAGERAQDQSGPLTDPLGRATGSGGGGLDGVFEDAGQAQQRAADLQEELRRRSGEQARPEAERDYLRRLLQDF